MFNPEAAVRRVLELGAKNAAVVPMENVRFEKEFRNLCASNACGMYGKSWMCPPDIGEPDELIAQAKRYRYMLVYQTIGELEDSYDFEGMMEAGQKMNDLTRQIRKEMTDLFGPDALQLGAGGCRMCPVCAKRENQPCRHTEQALSSLEAYCIAVSELAEAAGMRYINGPDTVTYFGAVLFQPQQKEE